MDDAALLKVNDLSVTFHDRGNRFSAVKGISFSIESGKTLALVGESGSGKSVSAMALGRLLPPKPKCTIGGSIKLNGKNLLHLSEREMRKIRGKEIAYVFQEPSTSLNPVFNVGFQIAEAIKTHRKDVDDVDEEVVRLLFDVGIEDATRVNAYPYELSGGMQQRVMIAMALACQPKLFIADEPTTALDVTIQKQILYLLKTLQRQSEMALLLITHNFGIIRGFADNVAVMFRGEIVEYGPTEKILSAPEHPYTKALIACIPRLDQKVPRLVTIDYDEIAQAEATKAEMR